MSLFVRGGGITSQEGITSTPHSVLPLLEHNTEPHCIVSYSTVLYSLVENVHKSGSTNAISGV